MNIKLKLWKPWENNICVVLSRTSIKRSNAEYIQQCNKYVLYRNQSKVFIFLLYDRKSKITSLTPWTGVNWPHTENCWYVWQVTCMWGKKIAHWVLVGKSKGKRPLESPRCRWVSNKNLDLQEIGLKSVDWIDLVQNTEKWKYCVKMQLTPGLFKSSEFYN
jgi:hypothetical protein